MAGRARHSVRADVLLDPVERRARSDAPYHCTRSTSRAPVLILVFSLHHPIPIQIANASRNIAMLFGTAVSGFSFPSISSET